MAYVSKEKKAKIATALKAVVPVGWRYSLAVRTHSTIVLTIQAAPVDLLGEVLRVVHAAREGLTLKGHYDVNCYSLGRSFDGALLQTMEAIREALNVDNYDKSDTASDYFNVGHYVSLRIGRWDKPFINIKGVTA